MKKKPKFLLLGWDSADWKVINPLIDKGLMPALERLINKGVMGNIATLDPPLSPMLWTSIATGKYAFKHGVHGFLEASEDGSRVGAVTSKSIQTSTIWEILNKNGFKTNVVGWWPSHPAGILDGVQVSNFQAKIPKDSTWNNWPVVPNAVFPKSYEKKLSELRVHPGELGINQLASFIPNYKDLTEAHTKFVNLLLADVAECLSVHATSTYLAEQSEWDFMAVYYNAIDHISHIFMRFHPPQLAWVDDEKFNLFQSVIDAAYRFHDLMLERWLDLIDEDCYVMVLSDHGFHSDEMRVKELPKEPAAIAREHNYLGMLTLCGPNVKKDELIYGSSLLDITPTILSIFGLEIGEDMDGKVLNAAFEEMPSSKFIPTWDDKQSNDKAKLSKFDSDELIKQLVDLGYVEGGDFDSPKQVKILLDENNFYLARSYHDAGKFAECAQIMNKLCNDYPENFRYHFYLANTYVELKEIHELRRIIDKLDASELKGSIEILVLKGQLHYLSNNFKEALIVFDAVLKSSSHGYAAIEYQIASTLLKLHQYEKALIHYEKNLKLNPNNAYAMHGKGIAFLALKKIDKAVDILIDSVSITYFNPSAHFHLGLAFKEIGAFQEAEQAFLVARQLAPKMSKAKLELLALYENELKDESKAKSLLEEVKRTSKGTVYIVSGLPRSGTSLMMQMLDAGGMPVLSDQRRVANEDNPQGYYEHEDIKRLASDNQIVYEAKDKAVKVIVSLLRFLPANLDYKVILMKRPVHEVVKSQDKMLQNLEKAPKDSTNFEMDVLLQTAYDQGKALLSKRKNMDFIEIDYRELIWNSSKEIEKLKEFLNFELDETGMKKRINKKLYRNK